MRGCEYISDLILKRRVSAVSKDGREFMRWVVLRDACGVYHRAARSLSSGAHSRDPLARTRWQAPQDKGQFLAGICRTNSFSERQPFDVARIDRGVSTSLEPDGGVDVCRPQEPR